MCEHRGPDPRPKGCRQRDYSRGVDPGSNRDRRARVPSARCLESAYVLEAAGGRPRCHERGPVLSTGPAEIGMAGGLLIGGRRFRRGVLPSRGLCTQHGSAPSHGAGSSVGSLRRRRGGSARSSSRAQRSVPRHLRRALPQLGPARHRSRNVHRLSVSFPGSAGPCPLHRHHLLLVARCRTQCGYESAHAGVRCRNRWRRERALRKRTGPRARCRLSRRADAGLRQPRQWFR